MQIDDIVDEIIRIPRTLHVNQDISIHQLLQTIGYYQAHDRISEQSIYLKLSQFPEYINEWIGYSEDKRTSSGYYIKAERQEYVVGYLGKTIKSKTKRFADKARACASFIKNELEEIRKNQLDRHQI